MNDTDEFPKCVLADRGEVIAILARLVDERTPLTVTFDGARTIVSSVLDVDRRADTMVLDVARDAATNERLFAAPSLAFATALDRIRIAFTIGGVSRYARFDGPAAIAPVPATLTRLQRREWFRAELPPDPPIRCTVLDATGRRNPARAFDLSCGGAGVVVDTTFVASGAAAPDSAHELILTVPEVGHFDVLATLRTVRAADDADARVVLGFRFERLPREIAMRIQRYVQRVEVERARRAARGRPAA